MAISALTKKDLINALIQTMEINKAEATIFCEGFFVTLADLLTESEQVRLKNFGKFEIQKKSSRMGRNPQTRKLCEIPEFKKVVFKASESLKKRLSKSSTISHNEHKRECSVLA